MLHSRSGSFTRTPAETRSSSRRSLMPASSPSPSAAEPSGLSFARRRSWVLAMDRNRRERQEAASHATAYRADEEIAALGQNFLGLPSDAFDDDHANDNGRPALRLRPQRRDSTRVCLACGRPVCETPRRNVSHPSASSGFCSCRLRCNSDGDDVLEDAAPAPASFFLSPATSERFVLELPTDDNVASWATEDVGSCSSSSDEEGPSEHSASGQPAFRKPALLQPKTVHRCHSDPLTSPTPAVPPSLAEEEVTLPPSQPTLSSFLPAPPIYSKEISATVNMSFRISETSMQVEQPDENKPLVSSSVAWAPETTFSTTKQTLRPRPQNKGHFDQAPLLPIDTPEKVKPTLSLKSVPNLMQQPLEEAMPPPDGFDTYVTPTQPRRKLIPDQAIPVAMPVLNMTSNNDGFEMELATPTVVDAKSSA